MAHSCQAEDDKEEMFTELLIAKHDISFQDMQSIARTFKDYVGVSVLRGSTMNDVIVAQAYRNAIVHAGGQTDRS